MDIFNKLKNMSDRDLLLFNIAETRSVRKLCESQEKLLANHLQHCWQIVVALVGVAGVAVVSLLITLLTK